MNPRVILLVGCSVVLAACTHRTGASLPEAGDQAQLFAYDRTAVFEAVVDSTSTLDGVTVMDAHFPSCAPKHGAVKFSLVRPAGNGPFAGVLFFHWLGRPKGNREEFLDEALHLASEGTVSLLIQGYFPWVEDPVDGPRDRQEVIDQTTDARRALELLLREPGVDPQRVAYVGHDYGAMFGAIIAGLESRVCTYVLVAGMGNFGDWSLKYWPATAVGGEKAYRDTLAAVDPIRFIAHAAPAALFFQFARHDKYIAAETAAAFSDAASSPKSVQTYDAEHDMAIPQVIEDRHAWLAAHLHLSARH